MKRLFASLVLITACGEPDPVVDDELPALASCTEGESATALLSSLRFVRPEEGISDGFDLDGAVTTSGAASGCGVEDFTDALGQTGIDNAFANLLPALEATEAGAVEPLIQAAINEGGLQVVVRWRGINDPENDTCVTFDTFGGAGEVFVGTQDRLLPYQTIDVDPEAVVATVPDGTLAGGVLEAGPFELLVPFRVLDADINLRLLDARMRLAPVGDGVYAGVIGGGVDIAEVVTTLEPLGIDRGVIALLEALLAPMADLSPDEGGTCRRLSVSLAFEAVAVYLFPESPTE